MSDDLEKTAARYSRRCGLLRSEMIKYLSVSSNKNLWLARSAIALALTAVAMLAASCERAGGLQESQSADERTLPSATERTAPQVRGDYAKQRARMVTKHLEARDIDNQRVLDAMRRVPRHEFVPAEQRKSAYVDSPLPIGHQQTISQPYIVALMTQLVDPQSAKKALDIGTGSGYQAAVLAELVKSVHSIEIIEPLAKQAANRLQTLGYDNVTVRHGDGYRGWKSEAPFDIIIVAAAPDHVPQPLVDQLAAGGKMVIPVGEYFQKLLLIEKDADGDITKRNVAPVAFVPMTGEARQ